MSAKAPVLRPLPGEDTVSKGFWDAARRGELAIQRCADCGTYQHPPRPICNACGGISARYEPVSGEARLVTWTVTHHNVVPGMASALPFTCLVVELVEQPGLYMMSDLIDREAERPKLRCGMRMRATFPPPRDGNPLLPQFVFAEEGSP